jgi:hypothetical protein
MTKMQLALEQRFKDQTEKLNAANSLETIRSQEQLLLKQRLKNYSLVLGQAKTDLKSEQSTKNIEKV